jgi:aminomethyltransferase
MIGDILADVNLRQEMDGYNSGDMAVVKTAFGVMARSGDKSPLLLLESQQQASCIGKVVDCPPIATATVECELPPRVRTESSVSEPEPLPRTCHSSMVSEPDSGPTAPNSPDFLPEPSPQLEPSNLPQAVSLNKQLPGIVRNARFRKSCFFHATVRSGALDWDTYNHMLLPRRYDWYVHPNEEYEHLKRHVCIWDVAVERQVEIIGPDAVTLVELMSPRPLGDMKVGQCRYAVVIDDEGMVLNDPVVSRLADDRFWFSGADGDLILWAKGLAVGRSLQVHIFEAAVSPVALQGPKSTALVAELFGDWVWDLKYFHFKQVGLNGMPIVLARSGWSPEVGYELYLQDESRGNELWDHLMDAGHKYDLRPGCPNQKRRIEGGMLSFGLDMGPHHSILELGLPPSWVGAPGKCKEAEFVGKETLQRLHEEGGPTRRVVGLELCGKDACQAMESSWEIYATQAVHSEFDAIGKLTSLTFSPALDAWIGIGTVGSEAAELGTKLRVETTDGPRDALVRKLPFLPRVTMQPRPELSTTA